MNCIECGNNYDSEYLMFCPICGAKSPNVELPLASEFFEDEQGGKRLVPQGFMLEPISGYYYSIKKKQVSDRTYVNEITWFDFTSGKSAKKDYLMSSKEIASMTSQQKENITLAGILNNNLINERAQSASRKKKSFLVEFVVVVCISLGYCAVHFNWIKLNKDSKEDSTDILATENLLEMQSLESSPTIQVNPSTDPLQQEGYVFTEGDKKYFVPVSENYAIVKYKDSECYILYSFDETGTTIHQRFRIAYSETISESDKQTIAFQGTIKRNICFDDNVFYYDLPMSYGDSRDTIINVHKDRGDSILVDTSLDTFTDTTFPTTQPESSTDSMQQEGYVFTKADNKYLVPITGNHTIVMFSESKNIVLYSYDETGVCIQYRYKEIIDKPLSEEELVLIEVMLEQDYNASNINYDGDVIYYDLPIPNNYCRALIINTHKLEGNKILVDNYDTTTDMSQELGYTFTEADNRNFLPVSQNYVISREKQGSNILLTSFDEKDMCIQYRLRSEIPAFIPKEDYDKIIQDFENMGATNILIDEDVAYMDGHIPYRYNKEVMMKKLELEECEILVNVNELDLSLNVSPTNEPNVSGYIFTQDDKKYFMPASDSYIITYFANNASVFLFSFDRNGMCIQARVRLEIPGFILEDTYEEIEESSISTNSSNINIVGYTIYCSRDELIGVLKQEEAIEILEKAGFEIIDNKLIN